MKVLKYDFFKYGNYRQSQEKVIYSCFICRMLFYFFYYFWNFYNLAENKFLTNVRNLILDEINNKLCPLCDVQVGHMMSNVNCWWEFCSLLRQNKPISIHRRDVSILLYRYFSITLHFFYSIWIQSILCDIL